ncbi:MAG: PorT family protein [Bacteroidales bacterium]|nr:PorT family protein [Bacteroidales bacterium]
MKQLSITYPTVVLLLFVLLPASAQHRKPQYLQYEDLRPYHFGFFIGLHSQDFQIEHSGLVDENGATWYGSVPSYSPGFSVGVLGDYRLRDNLSVRLSPSIHFGSKTMALVSDQPDCVIVMANIRSNYIMLPLNLRYRGARTDNYRPYLLCGLSLGIDAGRRKKKEIQLKELNTYWELGVGCDIYTPYFRFVPELKICLGLDDIFEHNRNEESDAAFLHYTNAFQKITSRLLVLSFQFE